MPVSTLSPCSYVSMWSLSRPGKFLVLPPPTEYGFRKMSATTPPPQNMDPGKFLVLPPPPTEYGFRKISATTPPPHRIRSGKTRSGPPKWMLARTPMVVSILYNSVLKRHHTIMKISARAPRTVTKFALKTAIDLPGTIYGWN